MKLRWLARALAGAALMSALSTPASATVIGFEDVDAGTLFTFLPPGYQGFTWSTPNPNLIGEFAWVISPESNNTPLPAALPLFGTGLGFMGLMGWWRKRRAEMAGQQAS